MNSKLNHLALIQDQICRQKRREQALAANVPYSARAWAQCLQEAPGAPSPEEASRLYMEARFGADFCERFED